VLLVLAFQRIGIGAAYAYVVPGAIVWIGLLRADVHPALAGVLLGLLTPVVSRPAAESPLTIAIRALKAVRQRRGAKRNHPTEILEPLKQLRYAEREMLPPVVRVQMGLHPWVAYGVMPLFALANAGVSVDGMDLSDGGSRGVMLAVFVALVIGKPAGIVAASWLAVRLGWCRLPEGVTWPGVVLVGLLGGIGFTMSIFISTLAFSDATLLAAAKAGVLLASAAAGILGLVLGRICVIRARARARGPDGLRARHVPEDRRR
jgi:NhaA family Na+:H+ antiporter